MNAIIQKISELAAEAKEITGKNIYGDTELEQFEIDRVNTLLNAISNLTDFPEGDFSKKLLERGLDYAIEVRK